MPGGRVTRGRGVDVDGVVLDVDGVLVEDWRAIEGSVRALERLRAAGLPVTLLTNTTSRSRRRVAQALRDVGFDVHDDDVATAATATAEHLAAQHPGGRCLVLNDGDGTDDLGVEPVEHDADVVVVGSAGPDAFCWDRMNAALAALHDGAALVGMHRSLKWCSEGVWQVDGGAYLAALELAAGVDATVLGKPAPAAFRAAASRIGTDPGRTLMVGDSVDSDVLAAMDAGLVGALVRTGGFRPADLEAQGRRPDHVVDALADVPDLLGI